MARASIALLLLALGCAGSPATSSTGTLEAPNGPLARMSASSQRVVRAAPVHFLLLPSPYAEVAIATSGPHWSALSAREGEITVSLHGTDVTHDAALTLDEVQRAEPTRTVRNAPARFTVNEGIRSVAWNEHGTDWSLEVECFHPDTDARCTDDAFLADLASRLVAAESAQ